MRVKLVAIGCAVVVGWRNCHSHAGGRIDRVYGEGEGGGGRGVVDLRRLRHRLSIPLRDSLPPKALHAGANLFIRFSPQLGSR